MVETEESYPLNGGTKPVPRPYSFVKTIKTIPISFENIAWVNRGEAHSSLQQISVS